jgi:hypothetical protein
MAALTPKQAEALRVMAAGAPLSPRQLAERLWPDSPAWDRRTRRYGANRNGALGGTMPMLAAKLLWRLEAQGYVRAPELDGYLWSVTASGEAAAATH